MLCVVGLGNPGQQYTGTRHNVGYLVVDKIAARCSTHIQRSKYRALTATARIGRTEVLLLKPQTFMNLSGGSVAAACRALVPDVSHLVVVHDDVDLDLGRIRVRIGGGSGGHRGIESIVDEVGDRGFVRVRLGVGRPPGGQELSDYVLEGFAAHETRELADMVERAVAAVDSVIIEGVRTAMQKFNGLPAGDGQSRKGGKATD